MRGLIYYLLLILSIFTISIFLNDAKRYSNGELKMSNGSVMASKSIVVYELIEKYSDLYDVPKHIAYNIAYKETRYRGPFHWEYDPEKSSSAGAVGPMQVMVSTANHINDENVNREELRTNLDLNIETSMKLLNRLYKKYGNWKIVCGCYNTGRPLVNDYAIFCSTNKDYKNNWDRN